MGNPGSAYPIYLKILKNSMKIRGSPCAVRSDVWRGCGAEDGVLHSEVQYIMSDSPL